MSSSIATTRRHPLTSLATKIILFVFLSTFATALVVSWISIQSTHRSLRGVIDRLYPLSLAHAERRVGPCLDAARTDLEALAAEPGVVRGGGAAEGPLRRHLEATERWAALARIGPGGAVQSSAGAALRPEDVADPGRPAAVRTSDGLTHPALWQPLEDGGVLLGLLDRAPFQAILSGHLPDEHGLMALVDGGGRVLAASGPAPGDASVLPLQDASDGAATREYESGGRRVVGAHLALPDRGLHLVLQTPFEAAFAPVLDVVSRIFVIDLVVILLFSFLAYRVTGAVVRPIERLSDWARRIAEGQIDLEIPETGGRDEIGLLARTFNDMMRQLRRNHQEIETANRDLTDRNLRLQQANEVLNQLSITDGLTKLHNHRFFQDHLTREIKRVSRSGEPLSMLLIDIDDFKQLNDRFGHAAGDELLTRMAPLLNTAVREVDLVARYGGEEFVILAPNTDAHGAYRLAEKVRTTIAESSFILDDSLRPVRITVSIGVAQFGGNRKLFFQRTDEALYRAKAEGKNCVILDEESDRGPGAP